MTDSPEPEPAAPRQRKPRPGAIPLVLDAIRQGASTTNAIAAATGLSYGAVLTACTHLHATGQVTRRRAPYSPGPGARPYIYQPADPPP